MGALVEKPGGGRGQLSGGGAGVTSHPPSTGQMAGLPPCDYRSVCLSGAPDPLMVAGGAAGSALVYRRTPVDKADLGDMGHGQPGTAELRGDRSVVESRRRVWVSVWRKRGVPALVTSGQWVSLAVQCGLVSFSRAQGLRISGWSDAQHGEQPGSECV